MAGYDYRAARDRIMGIVRDGDGRAVGYVPSNTPIRERMLLVALVEFAPDIRPALGTLATMVGLGWREVQRLLRSMERKGLIRVESRPGQPNRYHLLLPTPVGTDTPVGVDTPVETDRRTPVGTDTPPLSGLTPEADKQADKKADKGCASPSDTPPLALESPISNSSRASNRKPKPKAGKVTEQSSEHKRVVEHYFATFEAHRGAKPAFGGGDGKAVQRLLKNLNGDADRACKAITDGFASWKCDTLSIREIASDPSKFIGAKPRFNSAANRVQNSGIDPFGESI